MNPGNGQVEIVNEETVSSYSVFNVVIPIIGHSTSIYPQNDFGEYLKTLPKDHEGIFQKDKWKHLWDLPGGFRHFLQKPKDLQINFYNYSEADELLPPPTKEGSGAVDAELKAVQLSFTLPTSAYATMLLREIFPKDSSTSGDYHKTIEASNN